MKHLIELNPTTGEPLCDTPSAPKFLLIQGGRVIDCQDSPVTLAFRNADRQADMIVAIGVVNEFGEREIAGICGKYTYRPFARSWLISIDGLPPYQQKLTDAPGEVLRGCLYVLKRKGRVSDPCNFGTVTIIGSLEDNASDDYYCKTESRGAFDTFPVYRMNGKPIWDIWDAAEEAEKQFGNTWKEVFNSKGRMTRETFSCPPKIRIRV